MALSWSKLIDLHDYVLVSDLGVSLDLPMSSLPLIGENPQSNAGFSMRRWFKVGSKQYIMAAHDTVRAFGWAVSDGAFAYVLTNDAYFDDGASSLPPSVILPDGRSFSWPLIRQIAKGSGDAHFVDIEIFSQRRVQFDRFEFFYRRAVPSEHEAPICIRVVPKVEPRIEAQPGASPNGAPAVSLPEKGRHR